MGWYMVIGALILMMGFLLGVFTMLFIAASQMKDDW